MLYTAPPTSTGILLFSDVGFCLKRRTVTVIGRPHLGTGELTRFDIEHTAAIGECRIPGDKKVFASWTIWRGSRKVHKLIINSGKKRRKAPEEVYDSLPVFLV